MKPSMTDGNLGFNRDTLDHPHSSCQIILLDIEGTTTPITFVYDVLFPYARAHLDDFLSKHFEEAEVQSDLALLQRERREKSGDAAQIGEYPASGKEERIRWAIGYVTFLMDQDRKSTALKSLQGKIWETGFQSGKIKGGVYPDFPPALNRWKNQGRKIGIYSSGSIHAQKLLFSHTTAGDLTPFLSRYFDTTTGPKTKRESYVKIARALSVRESDILFLTDAHGECEAAFSAGVEVRLCVRDEKQSPQNPGGFAIIRNFDGIFP